MEQVQPDPPDDEIEPELYAAAKRGDLEAVTRLLDKGAVIDEI